MRDPLHWLARVGGHHFLQPRIDTNDLARLDLDIRGGALKTGRSLVDQNARVGQGRAFALRSTAQKDRTHGSGHADAGRGDPRLDQVHRVIDRQPGVDVAARAVDVHLDLAVGILLSKIQQLRHDQVGDDIIDWGCPGTRCGS